MDSIKKTSVKGLVEFIDQIDIKQLDLVNQGIGMNKKK